MWDYSHQEKWSEKYPLCKNGKSPIRINTTSSVQYFPHLTFFQLRGHESVPPGAEWNLVVKENTLHLELKGDYLVWDGGLEGEYKTSHVVFHWGGVEHVIDNRKMKMEVQVYHFSKNYKSYEDATGKEDGVAVWAFHVDKSKTHNPGYVQIISSLPKAEGIGTRLRPVALLSLLPTNLGSYFFYKGSLTTPPCSKGVRWYILDGHVPLSLEQINSFQKSIKNASGSFVTKNIKTRIFDDVIVYSGDSKYANWWNVQTPFSLTVTILAGLVGVLFVVFR